MASQRQIAANRRNSLRSAGPTTIEGKTRVAANAVRHGFYAHKYTLGEESQGAVQRHFDLLQEFKPVGPAELSLVQQLTLAHWRIPRAHALIAEAYDHSFEQIAAKGGKATPGSAFRQDLAGDQEILHLERLLASAERSFRNSLRELLKIQEDLVEPGGPIEDSVKLIDFPDEQEATAGAGVRPRRQSHAFHLQTTPR